MTGKEGRKSEGLTSEGKGGKKSCRSRFSKPGVSVLMILIPGEEHDQVSRMRNDSPPLQHHRASPEVRLSRIIIQHNLQKAGMFKL